MPFEIVRNDITKMQVDAIVNAANRTLLGGGGVDGAIHFAAGPGLLAECRTLNGCETGQAKMTKGYRLPARYVIHTVGPVWHGGGHQERELLSACYSNSLALAAENGLESIAFPLISAGAYGYPKAQAMEVAVEAISRFLLQHEMMVYLVVFGRTEFFTGRKLFRDIQEYIDDHYVDEHVHRRTENQRYALWQANEEEAIALERRIRANREQLDVSRDSSDIRRDASEMSQDSFDIRRDASDMSQDASEMSQDASGKAQKLFFPTKPRPAAEKAQRPICAAEPDWQEMIRRTDEGFSGALLRIIDEKGMKDAECYKRANVDRRLFSKIRSDPDYRPSKPTALAFVMALELSMPQAVSLLKKAGFALTRSSKLDVVMEYCINNRIYDVLQINEILYELDLPLLGNSH